MQLKAGKIDVLERGEFDPDVRYQTVCLRDDLSVNGIVLGLDP